MKLALLVEYDGTRYFGFQYQVDVPTIQGELEKAIKKVTREEVRIKGAGRTDTGVHAKGQVVSFESQTSLPLENLIRALNFYLPSDIAVRAGREVPQDFDAQRSARSRVYRYLILNSTTPSPLLYRRALLVIQKLDIELMGRGAGMLVGKHNFASFAGSLGRRNPVRQVFRAEISQKGELIFFDVEADSFLPQQMRRMTAALIRLGLGRLSLEEFQELIDCGKMGAARWVAPPYGLYLTRVNYPGLQLWENA